MAFVNMLFDTAAQWTANNPILPPGTLGVESDPEAGVETGSRKMKLGTMGGEHWVDLPYITAGDLPLLVKNNLSDLNDAALARANLGLPKTFAAAYTQSSTSAPTLSVFKNQLSALIVWAYTSTGLYTGTLAGAFLSGKVPTQVGIIKAGAANFGTGGTWRITRASDNTITLETFSNNTATDGLLAGDFISFIVYN